MGDHSEIPAVAERRVTSNLTDRIVRNLLSVGPERCGGCFGQFPGRHPGEFDFVGMLPFMDGPQLTFITVWFHWCGAFTVTMLERSET